MLRPLRISSRLLAAAAAIAMAALASSIYEMKLRRDFSARTAVTIGTVIRKGALLGKARRSPSEWFCFVEYRFALPGQPPRQGWRLWSEACGLKTDGPVPIQYVVDNPDIHRPPDAGGPPFPPLLLWFAAGVMAVVGVIRRGSEDPEQAVDVLRLRP